MGLDDTDKGVLSVAERRVQLFPKDADTYDLKLDDFAVQFHGPNFLSHELHSQFPGAFWQ